MTPSIPAVRFADSNHVRGRLRGLFTAIILVALVGVGLNAQPTTAATPHDSHPKASGLTTNGRTNPLGLPGEKPTFGWITESTGRGVEQKAYEVQVGSSAGDEDVWSSGKVDSSDQVDVTYDGPALKSGTRYWWRVRVWVGHGKSTSWSQPAWFETGLLKASDWTADWIGAAPSGEVDKWANYTVDVDFALKNLAFGLFLRAKDTNNAYMWQVSVLGGKPQLRPHKRVDGNYSLLDEVDLSPFISADGLATGSHTLSVKAEGDAITTLLDGTVVDTRQDTEHDRGFVGFRTSVADPKDEEVAIQRVKVTSTDGKTLLDTSFTDGNPFDGGTLEDGRLTVKGSEDVLWHSPDKNLPLLRKAFTTSRGKTVKSARLYGSAKGIYEMRLNGKKVGDQYYAPGFTEYPKRIQSQTYDVTKLVRKGDNALAGLLGSGWWAGKVGMFGTGMYGQDVALLAQLRITYTDGSKQTIGTDTSWRGHSGPYLLADLIDGETYDARLEQSGWQKPGFDDSSWTEPVKTESLTDQLVPQPDEPVRELKKLKVVKRTEPDPGVHIYDFGQNMVGHARVRLQGEPGQTVRLRYGETLDPETHRLYTANLRTARVTDYYTFGADGTVDYEPVFSFHGFRYMEVTGVDKAPASKDVKGIVIGSDTPQQSTFETSNPMLNQLQSNITWGQRGNFLSVPTDTPARDERLGWTGDISVFAPTAAFNSDSRAFLGKWLADLRDTQGADGNVAGIAPQPAKIGWGSGGTGWSDAMITVPHALYEAYGDKRVLRENYAAMRAFFDLIVDEAGPDRISSRPGNADWLNLDDPTPHDVLATAYLAQDAKMMAEMADALGKKDDADSFASIAKEVRDAYAGEFISSDGKVTSGSQTAYAITLGMDLAPADARDAVSARYVAKIKASGDHLTTGFLGTPWLLKALSESGEMDKAFELLQRREYPSWGFQIDQGATTMWERWDGVKADGSFQDPGMNSFNHYAYGAVGTWMYQNIAGLRSAEAGYAKSVIAPEIGGGGLTHAAASLDTVHGRLSSGWKVLKSGRVKLDVTVPVNTSAIIRIPASQASEVKESGRSLSRADGVRKVEDKGDTVEVTVGSGSYRFTTHR